MWKSLTLATALVASLLAPAAAYAAPDPEEAATYVRTAYDGTIWEVTDSQAVALTYEEWQGLGFPSWTPADTEYIKVLTLPTVYAATWFNNVADNSLVVPIDGVEYKRAKPSVVYTVPWLDGLDLTKWGTSPELIVYDPNGYTLKLTYAQWRDAGFPAYTDNANIGFVKLSWDRSGSIAVLCDITGGLGGKITYADWLFFGTPTPKAVKRVAGDLVYGKRGSPSLYYFGPNVVPFGTTSVEERLMSPTDWAAMGRPAPAGYIPGFVPPSLGCPDPAARGQQISPEGLRDQDDAPQELRLPESSINR